MTSHVFCPQESAIQSSWNLRLLLLEGMPGEKQPLKSVTKFPQQAFLVWNLMHQLFRNTTDINACSAKPPCRPNGCGSDEICNSNLENGSSQRYVLSSRFLTPS
jgi:hypothetical protein